MPPSPPPQPPPPPPPPRAPEREEEQEPEQEEQKVVETDPTGRYSRVRGRVFFRHRFSFFFFDFARQLLRNTHKHAFSSLSPLPLPHTTIITSSTRSWAEAPSRRSTRPSTRRKAPRSPGTRSASPSSCASRRRARLSATGSSPRSACSSSSSTATS